MSNPEPSPLMTAAEVAEVLDVCPRTIWNLVARGELHPIRLGSRILRFSRAEVLARIPASPWPAAPGTDGPLLTTRQVADYLTLSRSTVWGLLRSGGLPAIRIGTQYRVSRKDLEEFLERRREA